MIQPDALAELERVMQKEFKDNTSLRASQVGGVGAAAKIMNFHKATDGIKNYEISQQRGQTTDAINPRKYVCF